MTDTECLNVWRNGRLLSIMKLSQQEIADTLGFTKSKVNSIIRELIQKGYVTQVNARGKYALTENANRELRNIQSTEAVV